MPEAAEPPVAPQRAMPTPQSAVADFLKHDSAPPPELPKGSGVNPDLPAPSAKPVAAPTPPSAPDKPAAQDHPDKPPTNAENWKARLAAHAAELKARDEQITSIKSEMKKLSEQASALPKDDPEKEELRKEREELKKTLSLIAKERDPTFKQKFDDEIDSNIKMVEKIIGGDKGKKVARILKIPELDEDGEKMTEIFTELNEIQKFKIGPILHEIAKKQEQRNNELAVANNDFERHVKEHERKTKTEQENNLKQQHQLIDKMFNESLSSFRDKEKGIAELMERDGDETWNSGLKTNLSKAKNILLGQADPQEVVGSVLRGAAFDAVKSERDTLREQVKAKDAQIAALQGASPGLRQPGNTNPANPMMPPRNTVATTPQQAMKNWLTIQDQQASQ